MCQVGHACMLACTTSRTHVCHYNHANLTAVGAMCRSTDGVAGNLYAVKFTPNGNGFILGNDGILLRYIGA